MAYKDINKRRINNKINQSIYRKRNKIMVFDHYGWKCVCCGETIRKFLTIDHVNNDGYKERQKGGKRCTSGDGTYRKIIRLNFPNTFQTLCMNCNFGKSQNNGVCPHKDI